MSEPSMNDRVYDLAARKGIRAADVTPAQLDRFEWELRLHDERCRMVAAQNDGPRPMFMAPRF